MAGKIVQLPEAEHREAQLLLPWYASGQLDDAERARVEAHLAGCARCRAELGEELRLKADVAALPLNVERGWAAALASLDAPPARRIPRIPAAWARRGAWFGGAIAAGLALAALLVVFAPRPAAPQLYHALSEAPRRGAGDVVVMFRPDATEAQLRAALRAACASLVDGPTPADAYVLSVPLAGRARALAILRAQHAVQSAEPIDQGTAP